jgi:hypothetical protein
MRRCSWALVDMVGRGSWRGGDVGVWGAARRCRAAGEDRGGAGRDQLGPGDGHQIGAAVLAFQPALQSSRHSVKGLPNDQPWSLVGSRKCT